MPTEKIKWILSSRKHKREKKLCMLSLAQNHPLQSGGEVTFKKDHSSQLERRASKISLHGNSQPFVDPLSTVFDGLDPLTSMSVSTSSYQHSANTSNVKDSLQKKDIALDDISPVDGDLFISWETHCAELRKFTTTLPLTLASSFLTSYETGVVKVQNNIPDRVKGTSQTSVERVKARLEKLDSLDDVGSGSISGGSLREMGGLTQEQFTQHLLSLKEEMKEAWNDEQRVKALKIAIQCVKALSLSPPEMFYPCKFAIIADLLDSLGTQVYTRLSQLLETSHSSAFFSPKYEAEETARNWFYKVTSIRELLPRIFLEASLLRCYSILNSEDGENALNRLILMCRGIGDPLVGAYIRTYIIHAGQKYRSKEVEYIVKAFEDLFISCKWGWNGNGIEDVELMNEGTGRSQIVAEKVFSPAFKWILQGIPKSHDNLQKIFKTIENSKSLMHYIVIKGILDTFPATVLSTHCLTILRSLDLCFAHGENPQEPLVNLASIVTKCPPPENMKFELLNGVWQLVVRIKPIHHQHYLKAATAWLQYTGKNFTITEVDKILGDVLKRLSKCTTTSHAFYLPLLSLLTCALSCNSYSEELYTLSSFRSLLSLFQRESVGSVGSNSVAELKKLLEAIIHCHKNEFTDTSVVHLLLSLFATLHDGINALTTLDEKRQIAHLVNLFIRQVNFGKDFELQLQFYVDSRAVFSGLDAVLGSLIQHVLRLQISTHQIVRGQHTGKTAAFERACAAYCFITIPSLTCPLVKLKLYLLTGSVAMINNCMGQGDACVKSAVKTILDIATGVNESTVAVGDVPSAISYVSACLVAVPDPPDAARPLYLFRGLENSLKSLGGVLEPLVFCSINISVLKGVCAAAMNELPYHYENVDGNDTLYGGDSQLRTEAEEICTELLSNILSGLKDVIGTSDNTQLELLCELLETTLIYGDISDSKIRNLAMSLLALINKYSTDSKLKSDMKSMFDNRQNVTD